MAKINREAMKRIVKDYFKIRYGPSKEEVKEIIKEVKEEYKAEEKLSKEKNIVQNCDTCGRLIRQRGNCLPCNIKAKKKKNEQKTE